MVKEAGNNNPWMFDPQSFGDVSKLFSQFNVPGVDLTAIVEARRKDIEALATANKATYEAMEAMVKKQTEMLSQAMEGIQDAVRSAATGGGIGDPNKQAELARAACQKALADMMELAEIARAAQAEAAARISARANEGMQEIREMMQRKS